MSAHVQDVFHLLHRGLFLEPDAYDEAADSDNAFVDGLFLVVIIGLTVAIAGAIGQILEWATTPDLSQIEEIVHQGLLTMPWYQTIADIPEAVQQFERMYDFWWRIALTLQPNTISIFARFLLVPLVLIIGWIWFALIAHGMAKVLGGNGTLSQTLAASALALSPALLYVFQIIPTIVVAGVVIWMLLARYIAVRRVHENLSWGRVLVAVLAPSVLLFFLFSFLLLLLIPLALIVTGGYWS